MKTIPIPAAVAAGALMLSGCASPSGPGAGDVLRTLVTDPTCAHHDELQGVSGAGNVPASLTFRVVRDCPASAKPGAAPSATTP